MGGALSPERRSRVGIYIIAKEPCIHYHWAKDDHYGLCNFCAQTLGEVHHEGNIDKATSVSNLDRIAMCFLGL